MIEHTEQVVLDEEESARVLREIEENMSCIMCPYFQAYGLDVQFGTLGQCQALRIIADRKAQHGIVGKLRAVLMRIFSRATWSLLNDHCTYYKRAKKIEGTP